MSWTWFSETNLELFGFKHKEGLKTSSISGILGGAIKNTIKTVIIYSIYLTLIVSLFASGIIISDDDDEVGVQPVLDNLENLGRKVGDAFSEIATNDADDDGLSDETELDDENLHVDRKDIQIVMVYSDGVPKLDSGEKSDLKTIWDNMNVSNPDSSKGINLNIVEEINAGKELYIPSDATPNERGDILDDWYENYIDQRRCGSYYMVVIGEVRLDGYDGWGDAPGHSSIVDGREVGSYRTGYSTRTRLVTHELLHNVVGDVNEDHIEDDSKHTANGWLSQTTSPDDEYLSSQVSDQLSSIGFRESVYHETVIC